MVADDGRTTDIDRSRPTAADVGAAATAAGLLACAWLFGPYFVTDMLLPRT